MLPARDVTRILVVLVLVSSFIPDGQWTHRRRGSITTPINVFNEPSITGQKNNQ